MRSDEGYAADGARIDRGNPRPESRGGRHPGSRRSRLANASKQLGILMEDVDIDAEHELAEALTDAVLAVDRACRQVDERDGGRSDRHRSPGRSDHGDPRERADDGVRETPTDGSTRAPLPVGRGTPSAGASEPE